MQRVLARAALLVLLCDIAVVAVRLGGSRTHVHVREVPGETRTEIVLPAGQSVVSGTATALAVDAETLDPVPPPFNVDAVRAALHGIVIDGERETAVWNGGRPLVIEGNGPGLDVSPAHVELSTDGVVVALDGAARPLLGGAYRTSAPVAVGIGGLATPRDGVSFTADELTTLEAAGQVRTARRILRLTGPGRVSATGHFTVRTREGDRTADTLVFGPGPFELSVTPVADGWTVTATLQGPVQEG